MIASPAVIEPRMKNSRLKDLNSRSLVNPYEDTKAQKYRTAKLAMAITHDLKTFGLLTLLLNIVFIFISSSSRDY